VFSVGLIMLECGLLENVNERIWKEGSDSVDRKELRILIARFRE
jgi:ribosomal protein L31E